MRWQGAWLGLAYSERRECCSAVCERGATRSVRGRSDCNRCVCGNSLSLGRQGTGGARTATRSRPGDGSEVWGVASGDTARVLAVVGSTTFFGCDRYGVPLDGGHVNTVVTKPANLVVCLWLVLGSLSMVTCLRGDASVLRRTARSPPRPWGSGVQLHL